MERAAKVARGGEGTGREDVRGHCDHVHGYMCTSYTLLEAWKSQRSTQTAERMERQRKDDIGSVEDRGYLPLVS